MSHEVALIYFLSFFLYRKLTGNPWTSRVKQINLEPCVGKWKASVLRISTISLLVSGYRGKSRNRWIRSKLQCRKNRSYEIVTKARLAVLTEHFVGGMGHSYYNSSFISYCKLSFPLFAIFSEEPGPYFCYLLVENDISSWVECYVFTLQVETKWISALLQLPLLKEC